MLLIVGAYTIDMGDDAPGKARGISAYDFSPKTGHLEYRGWVAEVNPSYLCTDPDRKIVYAVRECPESDGAGVTAFRVRRGGKNAIAFEGLGETLLQGDHPCHLSLVKDTLLVSCYTTGSIHVVGLRQNGSPGDHLQRLPLEDPQNQSHAHCEVYDAKRGRVYICDLGSDLLRVFDREDTGILKACPELDVKFPEGSGPRHGVLHPDGDFLLVNCEFRGRVVLINLSGEVPEIALNVPSLPQRAVEGASGAAIRLDRRGRNVYVSERNYSVISTLRLEIGDENKLFTRDTYPSGGIRPRDILLSPDGKWLLSANLKDHTLGVFRVGAGGALQLHRVVRNVKSPTCLAWMPAI